MILFALLVAHRVNSNCYKAQRRIYTKVAFTCVMDYTSLTGNFETEDFTMKIAVTYDNGNIFQHFGKTETFKVYEVEDNKVVSSEVIGSNGEGHGALRKDIPVEIMKRDILVEAAAVADADHTLQWKERMLERNAVHITKEHSMTELSLILLMIVESRLSSYVVQDR